MDFFTLTWQWLLHSSNWSGSNGVPHRLMEHIWYSFTAVGIAAVIALPLGVVTGHLRRGGLVVIGLGNAARALPTLGLLTLVVFVVGIGVTAPLVALTAIAVPPILVNSHEALRQVPPDTVAAARGMGMRPVQVLFQVEIPAALSLILVGFRTAAIQVVSTATIAAYVGLGGLGRYIFDGLAVRDYQLVSVGAFLAAVCAVCTEVIFVCLESLLVSPGLRQRPSSGLGRLSLRRIVPFLASR